MVIPTLQSHKVSDEQTTAKTRTTTTEDGSSVIQEQVALREEDDNMKKMEYDSTIEETKPPTADDIIDVENRNERENNRSGSGSAVAVGTNDTTVHDEEEDPAQRGIIYLKGIRFIMISICVAVMLFLVTIETSIATTSLATISRELSGFERANWIMSSYYLGYVAVMIIFAKLSDIFGRKPVFITCIVVFTVFSGSCATAQTMEQLIALRGIQGAGGGGCFALCAIILTEIVPPAQYGALISRIGVAIIVATVMGPIIGGEISNTATWRWIFLFNVPVGLLALALAFIAIPDGFPYHGRPESNPFHVTTPKVAFSRLDLLGFALLMLATLSFTACFQEADSAFAWDSAYVISLLVGSVVLWACLLGWERYVTKGEGLGGKMREPVLPWRFFAGRGMVGILLGLILVGCVMTTLAVQLPQRYQIVNKLSSIDAGVRILPYGAGFPVGMISGSMIGSKLRVPAIYLVMFGTLLQIAGCALLGTQSGPDGIPAPVYVYQIIAGIGSGMTYQMLYLMIPFTAVESDKAVGMGAGNQFRVMGSAFGLAISTSVFNSYIRSHMSSLGIADPLYKLSGGTLDSLPPDLRVDVQRILSDAYNRQMLVLCGFGAAQIPTVLLLLWRRKQILTV